jgi:hypothetical protein
MEDAIIYRGIDLRTERHIKAHKKLDAPTLRVKPIPIIVIMYIIHAGTLAMIFLPYVIFSVFGDVCKLNKKQVLVP